MKKIAVILSGCGHKDGAEITEAVSALISLSQNGAAYKIFAPHLSFTPTNHLTSSPAANEHRDILTEAARIARGDINELAALKAQDFDGLIIPGGFGAALHLCDWGQKGAQCTVHPEVQRVIKEFYGVSKPIGAICIAPVILAKVLGDKNVTLTIGNNKEVIAEIQKTGAIHSECPVDDYITDRLNKVITTPAYMYDAKPHQVFKGISLLVKELVEIS
jgi:enhancing lycopene biosynthesis protein 2